MEGGWRSKGGVRAASPQPDLPHGTIVLYTRRGSEIRVPYRSSPLRHIRAVRLVLSFLWPCWPRRVVPPKRKPPARLAASRSQRVFRHGSRGVASPGPLHFGRERTDPPDLNVGWEEVALGPSHGLGQLDGAVAITPAQEDAKSENQNAGIRSSAPTGRSPASWRGLCARRFARRVRRWPGSRARCSLHSRLQ